MRSRNLILIASAGLLCACGERGTVVLELTDAPPDLSTIEHVNVTLGSVDVHVAGGGDDAIDEGKPDKKPSARNEDPGPGDETDHGGWRTVTDYAGTFDLLALQNDTTAALGELELPDGKITQIRLHIDEGGTNEVVLTSGEVCKLDLAGVNANGIKINHPFKAIDVADGERVRVVIDFDVKESVDQSGNCSFALKPVIKIKSTEVE